MELINKHVLTINNINDKLIYNIQISNDIPDNKLGDQLSNVLNKYKNMITDIKNIKLWDFCKKLSNNYELLHHCIKGRHINVGMTNYDPISRAFYKFWELCIDFDLIDVNNPSMVYSALAEGPGGFIECFNYYRRKHSINTKDTIRCITLKPYANEIPGWKKSNRIFRECHNYKISYGKDGTGNLYNIENIKYYMQLFNNDKADLVTADGGFDFSDDYSNQEVMAFRLIFCEIVTGLSILKQNGNMVIKYFDIFQQSSIDMIYILSCYFDKLHIVKPFTSRPANSEKYIVCKSFKGISKEDLESLYTIVQELDIIFSQKKFVKRIIKNKIPKSFLSIIKSCNIYFISKQLNSLIKGLSYVEEKLNNNDINEIKKKQAVYAISWCDKYKFPINYRCRFLKENHSYNYIPNF